MYRFSHFVITRFNLKLYARDKKNKPVRTEQWLKHRFEMFEQYCLPSVAAQTCTNFTWLCLFDEQTPEHYRQRIDSYRDDCPYFCPVFYDEHQTVQLSHSLHHTIAEIIEKQGKPVDYLITTNLDNDDSLSIHAVGALQQYIKMEDTQKQIYSFLYGYQYFTKTGLMVKMRYTNNHFLTLTEPYHGEEELKTIISYRHGPAIKQFPTHFISTKQGMWLEIAHEKNVSNDFRINIKVLYIPVMRSRNFSDFGVKMKVAWQKQWLMSLTILPVGFLFTAIMRLITKPLRKK